MKSFRTLILLAALGAVVQPAERSKAQAEITQDLDEFRTTAEDACVYACPMLVAYKVLPEAQREPQNTARWRAG